MILCNPHLWLSVSPGELGRSREGRGRTTEQNSTPAFLASFVKERGGNRREILILICIRCSHITVAGVD